MINREIPESTENHNRKKNTVKEINFKVTIDEANLILEGLGLIPFAKVYALVAKIQEQAQQQLNGENPLGGKADTKNPDLGIEGRMDAG
jgi:hypothetical protein